MLAADTVPKMLMPPICVRHKKRKLAIILRAPQYGKAAKPKADKEFLVRESIGLLDFLLQNLTGMSRNNIKHLLTNKQVQVDGCTFSRYDYPLKKGQTVRINMSVIRGQNPKDKLCVIYEDIDLIVIDKPAGLLSISTDKEKELTAYHAVTKQVQAGSKNARVFIVHRLDRDTSGVLMFAKNERMKLALQDNWDKLVKVRGYAAVVEGKLKEKNGRIHTWLRETKTHVVYSSQTQGDGLETITDYRVTDESDCYSLLDINLKTGRKNQIRAHMKELGHPVAGDKKYSAQTDPLKRLGLHAYKLEFTHPFTNAPMCFEAKLPGKFKTMFSQ